MRQQRKKCIICHLIAIVYQIQDRKYEFSCVERSHTFIFPSFSYYERSGIGIATKKMELILADENKKKLLNTSYSSLFSCTQLILYLENSRCIGVICGMRF